MERVQDGNGQPTGSHLNDETLSSYLDRNVDGFLEEELDVETHLSRCARCRERFTLMRAARELVASPLEPVSAGHKASNVAAAVGAGFEEQRSALTRTRTRMSHPGRPVLIGVAAAVVALVVALPVSLLGTGSGPAATSASAKRSDHSSAGTSTGGAARAGVVTTTLPAARPAEFGSADSFSEVLDDLRTRSASGSGASPGANPLSLAPAAPSSLEQNSSSAASGDQVGPDAQYATCISKARAEVHAGAYGPGVVAFVTYRGRSAFVAEFWPGSSEPPTGGSQVAVVTTDGCHVLAKGAL